MAGIVHAYRYPFESQLGVRGTGSELQLATSGPAAAAAHFYEGLLARPRRAADLMLALSAVVGSRFYVPPNVIAKTLREADPVVTGDGERLRFEAFSTCCSVHARVDFLPEALLGDHRGRGTTNVDFGPTLRAGFARVRDGEPLGLRVGREGVELVRHDEVVVERKIDLPVRWLRGFVEVQSYQSRLEPRLEVNAAEARRFVASLPRSSRGEPAWAQPAGNGLRLARRAARDSVSCVDPQRLRVLEPVLQHAERVRIHATPDGAATNWEVVLAEARLHLLMSPAASRGFSGEGQALTQLAATSWQELLPRVRASLRWQGRIERDALAREIQADTSAVEAALAALGARGLVGFDAGTGAWFHRELPFDLDLVEELQPRLADAREILDSGGVRLGAASPNGVEAWVRGTTVEHLVKLRDATWTCTCPWIVKHGSGRGPCKHVLAAQLATGAES